MSEIVTQVNIEDFNNESYNAIEGFNPSDDAKIVILEKGITSVDDNGNFLNSKGEVVINKESFDVNDFNSLNKDNLQLFMDKYFAEPDTAVLIDGVEYALDTNGNAINADGTIFKTGDEIKALELVVDNVMSIDAISLLDGYELLDENNTPIIFEDSIDGLVQRQSMIIERESVNLANNHLADFFENNPDIVKMAEYKKLHGSLDNYNTYTDYSKIVLDPKNDKELERYIIAAEIKRGKTTEDAARFVKYSKADRQLEADAKASLVYLQAEQKRDEDTIQQNKAITEQTNKDKVDRYWSNVKALVDNGKILDYKLPENFRRKNADGSITTVPRSAFYDYINKPVQHGKTQEMLDREAKSANTENLLFDALLLFLGGNTEQLIEAAATTKNIKSLTTNKTSQRGGHTVVRVGGSKTRPIDNIRIN